ncbi:MAG: hypothetical protein J0L75_10675 [Spirochaetes bacterium]|nr:hypothetical protein [Spirochaetota bacterium]
MAEKALLRGAFLFLLLVAGAFGQGRYPLPIVDSDGDGLSDEDEICKYLTDPLRRDSDGNGKSDGDWNERRQFTTTLRATIRVLKPYDSQTMLGALPESARTGNLSPWVSNAAGAARLLHSDVTNDAFQDVRVVAETARWVDLEIVAYLWNRGIEARRAPDPGVKRLVGPLAARLPENEFWRQDRLRMDEWLRPRKVCQWDEDLRVRLVKVLRNDRIDPTLLTDTDLVETVVPWLLKNGRCLDKASLAYRVDMRGKVPAFPANLAAAFDAEKPEEIEGRETFANLVGNARNMVVTRSYEWGLPWCAYVTTVLRALGIPSRLVQFAPIHDVDEAESSVRLARAIWHPRLRAWFEQNARYMNGNHLMEEPYQVLTMVEVYVGNRWRLVHLPKELGGVIFPATPILYHATPGYLLRIHTFADPGERDFSGTWAQQALGRGTNAEMPTLKPWRVLAMSLEIGRSNRLATTWVEWMSQVALAPAPLVTVMVGTNRVTRRAYVPGPALPSVAAAALLPSEEGQDTCTGAGSWAWPTMPDEFVTFSLRRPDQPAEFPAVLARSSLLTNLAAQRPPPRTNEAVFTVLNAFWFDSEDRPKTIPDVVGKPISNERWILIQVSAEKRDESLTENFLLWASREFRLKPDKGPLLRLETTPLFWDDHILLRLAPWEGKNLRPGVPYRLVAGAQIPEWRWSVAAGLFLEVPGEGDAP